VVLLGFFKHKTIDVFHAQRLDDEFVPKSTYAFLVFFALISAVATYNVTTPALEYLAKAPVLLNVDSVSLRFDSLMAADMVVMAKSDSATSVISKEIKRTASYKGKLDSASRKAFQAVSTIRAKGLQNEASLTVARAAEKEFEIKKTIAENDKIIQKHKDWCASFGSFLGWLFIALEFALYPSTWYCKDYEKKEVIEADKKKEAKEAEQAFNQNIKVEDKEVKEKDKGEVTEKTKVVDNQEKTTIGFVHNEGKEGDIVKGEGKVRDRVLVMVNGALVAKTKGELNTLIRGQSTSERIKHLENIKTKLN
jgi:hypothetical protein